MSALLVLVVYGASLALALFLLYEFHARSWYWHAFSVLIAITLGLIPTSPEFKTPVTDLVMGAVFTFLMIWGVAAPLFRSPHGHHHQLDKHA